MSACIILLSTLTPHRLPVWPEEPVEVRPLDVLQQLGGLVGEVLAEGVGPGGDRDRERNVDWHVKRHQKQAHMAAVSP